MTVQTWRCGFCGYQTDGGRKPDGPCPQCNDTQWEPQPRGEEVHGDHLRPGD